MDMMALIDRLLLFCISILMFNKNQVDYIMVCLILAVIIMEATTIYLKKPKAVMVISIIFVICSLIEPQLSVFVPLIIYENICVNNYIVSVIEVLVAVILYSESLDFGFFSKEVYTIVVFILVAAGMGIRSRREQEFKDRLHNMQDEESYLRQKNRQNHEELVKKQDYEIHAATLTERNRIAREIHDHVGHMLSRSILQLGAIMAVNKDEKQAILLRGLKDSLDTAMNNIRESVHDLKDDALDLEYMVRDITGQYETLNIDIDYDMGQFLSKEMKYCFVAIVKEALTNTVKHSDGDRVTIVMREHPALYQILIEDNGSGSEKAVKEINSGAGKSGIGLDNMRERVSAFGGNIRFSGENGFKIFISIPKEV